MRILIADTAYPEFLKTVPVGGGTYDEELQRYMSNQFGTFDAYSRNLRALGHECIDVISNHDQLQRLWAQEYMHDILDRQIRFHEPDVLFLQDLSLKPFFKERPPIVAAQCSCAFDDSDARRCDVIFTSLPTHVPRIEALGVRAVYNPLAFEPDVLNRLCWCSGINDDGLPRMDIVCPLCDARRIHDVVFIGGVGAPSHWKRGMEVLETVARELPTFKWWGYGVETLPADSALRAKYQGQAWGLDMYRIMLQSKMVLNRHGEVADGYANNMRLFEATGCGAMLLTEDAPNIDDFFNGTEAVTYTSASEAVFKIQYFLENEEERAWIAQNGQARTLTEHTYEKRMKTVSDTLMSMPVAQ